MKRPPLRVTTVVILVVSVTLLVMAPRLVDSIMSAVVSIQNAGYNTGK